MNRLLLGTMLWAVICLAAGCTEDDETTKDNGSRKSATTAMPDRMPAVSQSEIKDTYALDIVAPTKNF